MRWYRTPNLQRKDSMESQEMLVYSSTLLRLSIDPKRSESNLVGSWCLGEPGNAK